MTRKSRREIEHALEDLEGDGDRQRPPAARAAVAAVMDAKRSTDSVLLSEQDAVAVYKSDPDESPADVPEGYLEAVETPRRRWFVPVEYVSEDHRDALPVGISDEPFLVADFTHTTY